MKLKEIVEYVNKIVTSGEQYGEAWQKNKKKVHRIDDTSAFIYDANFLVVGHKTRIYVYHEDDGAFIYQENGGFDFNSSFTHSLISLLSEMQHYISIVGIPYHYTPECVTRCGFALGVKIDEEAKLWQPDVLELHKEKC